MKVIHCDRCERIIDGEEIKKAGNIHARWEDYTLAIVVTTTVGIKKDLCRICMLELIEDLFRHVES